MTLTLPTSESESADPVWTPGQEFTSETGLFVTALLVVQQARTPWLSRTLDALVAQRHVPDRLVVVDATPQRQAREIIAAHPHLSESFPDISVVAVPGHAAFAAVVDTAVDALPGPGEDVVVARRARQRARKRQVRPRDRHEWFWLLHEDSAPDAGALDALVHVVGRTERIGVAGCKVIELAHPDRLVNVGLDLTRTGRHVGATMQGEPDQGQHDARRDVLAVSSAGMLIRRDVYLTLGGFDPAFDGDGDGLDLCWRTHLVGHQVVVVPAARVHQDLGGQSLLASPSAEDAEHETAEAESAPSSPSLRRHGDANRPAPQSARTLRRHRQVALARCAPWAVPFVAVWITLSCTALGLVMLLLKRPRHAAAELGQATAPLGVARVLSARARFFRRSQTRRRDLEGLFVPFGAAGQHAWDAVQDAVAPEPQAREVIDEVGRLETGPVDDEADSLAAVRATWLKRTARHAGFWSTLALVVATGFMWRHLLRTDAIKGVGEGLLGGELRPFDTDAAGIWRLWRDHWVGPGLGGAAQEQPYLPVLAGLARLTELLPWVDDSRSGATAVAWLLLLAMPLSGVSAYVAGRAATRAQWPRAAAALVWGSLATLTTAVSTGRIGPVVAHILLPLVLAGTFSVARRQAMAPMTFGTVLAAAVMGSFSPAALALTSVAALGVIVLASGWARLRGAILLLLPWAMLGPWTARRLVDDWRVVLGGPGSLQSGGTPEPWQLALLHPGGPGSYLALLSAPVLVLGVVGLVRSRAGHGRVAVALGLLALLGLAAGLAASHLTLTSTASARTPWPGPALDVMALALLGAALWGGGDYFSATSWKQHARRLRPALAVGLVLVIGWALLAVGTVAWTESVTNLAAAKPRLPAVASQLADGPRAIRMLKIDVGRDGSVVYNLEGSETGLPARDLDVPVRPNRVLGQGVTALLAPAAGGSNRAHRVLADLGVAYVGLSGDGDRSALSRSLESADGLSPMASNPRMQMWRVNAMPASVGDGSVPSSRVRVMQRGGPAFDVPARGPHARTSVRIPAGAADRDVQISEAPGWADHVQVQLNGKQLQRVHDTYPTYRLGADGGRLVVEPALSYPRWRWAQGAALLLVIFLAVPFGNARSRRNA